MDDLEATLDGLDRRLRALQDELGAPAPPADPLDRFGDHLRHTTAALVAAYDRALAEQHAGEPGELVSEDLAIEARTDLPGLCALARALTSIGGVQAVDLRAYAGGHAVLDVALDRPVALVRELRAIAGPPIAVVAARPGRLEIEVGGR